MKIFLLFTALLCGTIAKAQLYINEISATNTLIKDPDYNSDEDWIEIYNASASSVNLKGYYLTDNLANLQKWVIGADVMVAPNSYVVFWADGRDIGKHTNFKLAAEGEEVGLASPSLVRIDSVKFGLQKSNISYGRNTTSLAWGFFQIPTPGLANNTTFYNDVVLNTPEFKPFGGLFSSSLSVELFNDLGGVVRYTLDGSEPTLNSPLYVSDLQIDTTTIVRARVFKPNFVPGPITTHTYFINNSILQNKLPVVSLASNSENFWDPDKGIYVQDFKPDWEIPANIELFENNGSDRAALNEMAGVKINGLYSWQLPQKMLGVYFKKQYGNSSADYPVMETTNRASYKTFALRASGNDWSQTLMRDIVGQQATLLNSKLDISAWRWCTVYINGKYMGIHNIREKIEEDYIVQHYKLSPDSFDMVENEDYPEVGNLNAYNEIKTLFQSGLANQSNFDKVLNLVDIENFTDLIITELASGNFSISHNVMCWKPYGTGKWRWILMDLDRGYYDNYVDISFVKNQSVLPFREFMENERYVNYFAQRLADHIYTSYNLFTMNKYIDSHKQAIASEIPNHVDRWMGATSSYGNAMPSVGFWYDEIGKLKKYVKERPEIVLSDLTNYGSYGIVNLIIGALPSNAGEFKINTFKVPESSWTGLYVTNIASKLIVEEKAGYQFKGWVNTVKSSVIPKGSLWKYLDNGTYAGNNWTDTSFNDTNWKSGAGILGYGGGNEKTIVSFGPNSQNKYVTTYFRKIFNLVEADLNAANLILNILVDDAAVVYLNGVEVVRDNIEAEAINYKTFGSSGVSAEFETRYTSFIVDKNLLKVGKNIIAIEVHQESASSSDLSFDLELQLYFNDGKGFISTSKELDFNLTADKSVAAIFNSTGECVLPEHITTDFKLEKTCSPYVLPGNCIIDENATLTIEPGVEVWMSENSNVFIHGNIIANGTELAPVKFKINPKYENASWGALNFENTSDTSLLKYVFIEDASKGPIPVRVGAISGFHTDLRLDHITIDNNYGNPIAARYSDVSLTNSYIHSTVVSDLINIKYGKAVIDNCEFHGNPEVDADGIDYDGIENGVIRKTKIFNVVGYNSDAIDIGEETKNVIIDSVLIYNVFDKGVSVGQRSSVKLTNSTLVNCNMGLGIKDSSWAVVNHCNFYSNAYVVNCYEKNAGRAGGNAIVKNSILSNSSEATYSADNKSTIAFFNCLSDNNPLPFGNGNLYDDPDFNDPLLFDYDLFNSSPCINTASDNTNLGSGFGKIDQKPEVVICSLFPNALDKENAEFIGIYNPTNEYYDVSGYSINKGITITMPQNTLIAPYDTLFLTNNAGWFIWGRNRQVLQWGQGKLSNNGEAVQLLNKYGIVVDYVNYKNDGVWPTTAFTNGEILMLKNIHTDNHFGYNWTTAKPNKILDVKSVPDNEMVSVFPNPSNGMIFISESQRFKKAEIYSIIGVKMGEIELNSYGVTSVNLENYNDRLLLIKVGNTIHKILIKK